MKIMSLEEIRSLMLRGKFNTYDYLVIDLTDNNISNMSELPMFQGRCMTEMLISNLIKDENGIIDNSIIIVNKNP